MRRVAAQVDDRLVDDLVLSARAAPALVATASRAVGEFQLFVEYAQGARAAADQLLVDVAGAAAAHGRRRRRHRAGARAHRAGRRRRRTAPSAAPTPW